MKIVKEIIFIFIFIITYILSDFRNNQDISLVLYLQTEKKARAHTTLQRYTFRLRGEENERNGSRARKWSSGSSITVEQKKRVIHNQNQIVKA